eukprot:NODE_31_length_32452_cov_0.352672.p3 type:complete len:719 gc:universal NODE_31_length_32452_cov_0.352672:15989-13833(-)
MERIEDIMESPEDGQNINANKNPYYSYRQDQEIKYNFMLTEAERDIMANFKKCLSIRSNNILESRQRDKDNPKNSSDWDIYPHPPAPSYIGKERIEISVPMEFNLNDVKFPPADDAVSYKMIDGVFHYFRNDKRLTIVKSLGEYYRDLDFLIDFISDGPTKTFAFRRLRYLEAKYQMYSLVNENIEISETKSNSHRDFYNVRKIDTHIHLASSMNQKHLLRFIKSKIKKCPDEIVIYRDAQYLTLNEVFQSLGLQAYDLSIDTLDMHAHKDSFHRFDRFNLKYNPMGESRLREIFLKTDNHIKGRYMAELVKEVCSDLEQSKYQMAEYRISIYGRNKLEWTGIAKWVVDNKIFSNNIRWLIQVPRLYNLYKEKNLVKNFAEFLDNLFEPLFKVTINPESNMELYVFLQRVVGFDSVDDESKIEKRTFRKYPLPQEWSHDNPPYSYYLYYMYANISTLNQLRKERNLNTFVLRPHSGEAGDTEHLASAFLTSYGISHGILLRKVPALQYLYYLHQIGIAMSPLSNNALFLSYERNPFPIYYNRGLNVSLSTDDPLQFHFTREPLIEEYSVAAQIYKLSGTDMCELARNSVLQCGWERKLKQFWLGPNFTKCGVSGNDILKSNVPNLRILYRYTTLVDELCLVLGIVKRPHPLILDGHLANVNIPFTQLGIDEVSHNIIDCCSINVEINVPEMTSDYLAFGKLSKHHSPRSASPINEAED